MARCLRSSARYGCALRPSACGPCACGRSRSPSRCRSDAENEKAGSSGARGRRGRRRDSGAGTQRRSGSRCRAAGTPRRWNRRSFCRSKSTSKRTSATDCHHIQSHGHLPGRFLGDRLQLQLEGVRDVSGTSAMCPERFARDVAGHYTRRLPSHVGFLLDSRAVEHTFASKGILKAYADLVFRVVGADGLQLPSLRCKRGAQNHVTSEYRAPQFCCLLHSPTTLPSFAVDCPVPRSSRSQSDLTVSDQRRRQPPRVPRSLLVPDVGVDNGPSQSTGS